MAKSTKPGPADTPPQSPEASSVDAVAVEATEGEATPQAVAEDPKVVEAIRAHAEASANTSELRSALAEAEAHEAAKKSELNALTVDPPPTPITGPRIKVEGIEGFVQVQPGEERERRLLLNGRNLEHVSGVVDNGEVVWVYRVMP